MQNKPVKGTIILNGNIPDPTEMIYLFRDSFLNSRHTNPEIKETRKVLLITAAMQKHEWGDLEQHIRNSFHQIGIPEIKDSFGFDVNVQNLSLYHTFQTFIENEYRLYRKYRYKQDMIMGLKEVYRKNNISLLNDLWEKIEKILSRYPEMTLFEIVNASKHSPSNYDLSSYLLGECEKASDLMTTIINSDRLVLKLCDEIENDFILHSGVSRNTLYQEQKYLLEERINSASSVFITGGNPSILNNRIRFYQLKNNFHQSYNQGTSFFGISSGSLLLTDRISYAFEKIGCPLEAYDRGTGLIENLIIFPHADDYNYISSVHNNNLSFYALRHLGKVCIGLNQYSFLQINTYLDEETNTIKTHYVSMGEDPMIIFCKKGNRIELKKENQLKAAFSDTNSDLMDYYCCFDCEGYLECFE